MVQIYRKKWQRSTLASLLGYCRDWLILTLPIKRVPPWLVKRLYGATFQFAFLVHPRAYQDVFISMPAFRIFKLFFRKKQGFKFFSNTNPFVLNTVRTQQDCNGCVIAQLTVPEIMFLGGWFPMITKRGQLLDATARALGVRVTNGHCGTLTSIYMTIEKIAGISRIALNDMTIAVIGVGKMGANVARALNGKVKYLILIDINAIQLQKVKEDLSSADCSTEVSCVLFDVDSKSELKDILHRCHVGVCATSSYRNILKLRDLPTNFIGIDDSRPEALPRDPRKERIILEGGLLKISKAKIDYNYGFGEDDNVFGCLGEAFLLALDKHGLLMPTLGDVNRGNFFKMVAFCRENGVSEGDLKSSNISITDDDIRYAMDSKITDQKPQ
ncbi:MAG: hypothetical protein UX30_C0021G0005 [Candidatus Saccharibacteria bacterium GW2011_GWA2_46_10]|nr:MAG: hypothetical protein UX30_C0021G0005 [Candidatus Saccharibacteria bacterium GW2011_GWA2_46_10]